MMENHVKPEKRKHPEGPVSAPKNAKKLRLQVVVPKLQVTQEQLKKLKRKNLSTNHENPGDKYEEENENNADVYNNNVSGSSSQIVRESPVRHRLSNLLDGSVLSPDRDQGILPEYFDEKRTNTNFDEDNCKTLTNSDMVKACLFYANGSAADGNSTCCTENEQCITAPCYPEVVTKTGLQESETSTTSDSAAVGVVPSSIKTMNCGSNGVDQQLEEKQSAKDDTVVSVSAQETESKSSASSSFNVAANDVSRTKTDGQGNKEAVPFSGETNTDCEVSRDSGCSSGDNSIDYASGYNTLEVVNSLLSDLNEERNRRIELDERMITMEMTNQKLLVESQKLKEMVNDLLQSKVKGGTVSRGTQINMDISLRRGRAVDRATSPLRLRDPSPELQLLSFSVGCQTNNNEVEHPKMMVSSLSQTDEEVIPPKILVSVASQTNLVMPAEVWPHVWARAAPQSHAAQAQQMVRPTFQATAPVQRQNLSHSTQASNVFHTTFTPSGQFYQLPLGLQAQQTSSFQGNPQIQSTAQVIGNQFPSSVGTSVQHPTTAGYQSCAQRSVSIRTSQSSAAVQQTPVSSASHSQVLPLLGRQVVTSIGLVHPSLNTFLTSYNSGQQSYPVQFPAQAAVQTSHTFHQRTQSDGLVQSVRGRLYSAQQQNNGIRSYQQTADPHAALQSRVITGIEPTRTLQTQHQLATAGNQTIRNSAQPNRLTLQQNISQQQPSSRLCAQPTLSQPQTQVHPEFRTQRNTAPQYQQGNASTNQSTGHVISMQQSVLQPSGVQTPLQTQANSLRSQSCLSTHLNASTIRPVQQSVSQAMAASVPQLPNLRTAVPVRQSQATNLSVPVNQARVTPQQSAHLLPVQSSVQARSSNTYNNTIRQLIHTTAERNAQVSENDLRTKSDLQSQSLFNEIRRVYSELQQSLDEITANKQKERSIEKAITETLTARSVPVAVSTIANTTSRCSSSVVTTTDCTTSIHYLSCLTNNTSSKGLSSVRSENALVGKAHNVGDTHSRASSASTSLQKTGDMAQGSSAGQETTSLFTNQDYHKKPAKTPSGALENTVQRLLANQSNTNSKISPTSISVSDLFDGTNSMEPSQSEVGKSGQTESQPRRECAGVCLETSERNSAEADSLHFCKETNRGKHDFKVSSTENVPSLAVKSDNVERLLEGENRRDSNLDSVFIAPQNPIKRKGDIDKDKDDVYVELMSPVIPHGDSGHRDSDSVFAVLPSPVKTKEDSEKNKDELYVNLMSPIIPVPAPALAKRCQSGVHQHECVDVATTRRNSTDDEQDIDTPVQKTESADKVTNYNSNQTDIEETVNRTKTPDPDCVQTPQDERQLDDFTQENEKDAPERVKAVEDDNIGEDRVTVAEPELPIAAHRDNAVTDVNELAETETVLEASKSKEGGDNVDGGIEINTGIKQCISAVQQAVSTVNSADSRSENDDECLRGEIGENSVQKKNKVGQYVEVDTQRESCVAETRQVVDMGDAFAENDSDIALSGVEAEESGGVEGNVEDMECDDELQQDLSQGPVAETGQDKGDTCRNRVVKAVLNVAGTDGQKQLVDSVSPHLENDMKLLRKGVEEHSEEDGGKVSESVKKNSEHKQGTGDTLQAVSTAGSVDIHTKNTSQLSYCMVETKEHVVEDVEADAGPRQAMDKTKLAVPSIGTLETNVKNGRDSVSESTGTGEEREETMEQSVAKETVRFLESKHSVEGVETDPEPIQSFARVRAVMTNNDNADISVQNNSNFSVVRKEESSKESLKAGGSTEEEMNTEVKDFRGVDIDETVGNTDNVSPCSGLLTPVKENSHVTESTTLSSGEHSCNDKVSNQQLSSVVVQELTKNWEASSMTDVSVKLYEIGVMQNQPSESRQEARQSLVNGGDITGMRISSNRDIDQNETENVVTSDPSPQHLSDGVSLPKPRVAVRSVGNNIMIMWDLPASENVSEIEYYELYSWGCRDQWFKVAKMKALRLPMGCMLEHLLPGKVFWFRIRAVSRDGVNGPFSETSSYCLKEG